MPPEIESLDAITAMLYKSTILEFCKWNYMYVNWSHWIVSNIFILGYVFIKSKVNAENYVLLDTFCCCLMPNSLLVTKGFIHYDTMFPNPIGTIDAGSKCHESSVWSSMPAIVLYPKRKKRIILASTRQETSSINQSKKLVCKSPSTEMRTRLVFVFSLSSRDLWVNSAVSTQHYQIWTFNSPV